jgi:dTDP-4-dehydrorhamnose reductase
MSRHIVIGASGLVGQHIMDVLQRREQEVAIGTYYQFALPDLHFLDIRDSKAVADLLSQFQPEVIYLPASLTDVDYCENHSMHSFEINVVGTCNVVKETNRIRAKLVFFSSDYLFDGLGGPYSEDDPAQPISEYGRHKLSSEHFVSIHSANYLIVRTTVVYGWEYQGKNFVQRLVAKLREGETVRVPTDQVGTPTYALNLAEAVIELVSRGLSGVYHIAGPQLASRYDFALAAANVFGLDAHLIQPVSTAQMNQTAPRPLAAGLRVDKATKLLNTRLIGYVEGLKTMALQEKSR